MSLANEIRNGFAITENNEAVPLESLPSGFEAWVIRMNNRYGVAVELSNDSINISEKFSNVRFGTEQFIVSGVRKRLLCLTSNIENLRYEFANLCALFVGTGDNGDMRNKITQGPLEWWKEWKELLGNANLEKSIHGVMGELIIYLYLVKNSTKPNWTGPTGGSVDFETIDENFEVKSTLSKYNANVTITSQFQLDNSKKLSLFFCRLEEKQFGYSIDDLVNKLDEVGISHSKLNKILSNIGFEQYASSRKKKFDILELRRYRVNEAFPAINLNSFKDSKMPDNILQFSYTVNLDGLNYERIEPDYF